MSRILGLVILNGSIWVELTRLTKLALNLRVLFMATLDFSMEDKARSFKDILSNLLNLRDV